MCGKVILRKCGKVAGIVGRRGGGGQDRRKGGMGGGAAKECKGVVLADACLSGAHRQGTHTICYIGVDVQRTSRAR